MKLWNLSLDHFSSSVVTFQNRCFEFSSTSMLSCPWLKFHPLLVHLCYKRKLDGLGLTVYSAWYLYLWLQDSRCFTGQVEDVDHKSDLATIRIDCRNLPVMKLGQSSTLRPGEFVVAMGSPLALSNTITTGVVSTVARDQKVLPTHLRLSWKTTTFSSGTL